MGDYPATDPSEPVELVVIGAGPAGTAAAVAASRAGIDTLIIDEARTAGGQVYRALPPEMPVTNAAGLGPDHGVGERLRHELSASPVRAAFGHRVWHVAPGGWVRAVGPQGLKSWRAQRMIVATGTVERIMPFPGWTTPGVIGLAAATILVKAQQVLPGRAVVVAGCGPLVAAVAAAILKGGGQVAAIVDLAGPGEWLAAMPALASRPDLLARGIGWLGRIRAAGVPIFFRHTVISAEGTESVTAALLQPIDDTGRPRDGRSRRIEADAIVIGHGLVPSTDVTRLLRLDHAYVPERGGWVVIRDEVCRTSDKRVYVAGDGAGISGALAAEIEGKLSGLTAAFDLGRLDHATYEYAVTEARPTLHRARRFGNAMGRMMALRTGLLDVARTDTVVCRCEHVSRGEIEAALADGADYMNRLKSWTRCGMGPCQGRMCGDAAATLVARSAGGREAAGTWTARVPIRPVPYEAFVADYRYEDLPFFTAGH